MEPTDAYLPGQRRPIMKSAPHNPRAGECKFDGAFPKAARGLAAIGTDANVPAHPYEQKDYQAGRLMMIAGSAVTAVGSLTLMGIKPKRKDQKAGTIRRVIQGMIFTLSVASVWAIMDSDIRKSTLRAIKGTPTGE